MTKLVRIGVFLPSEAQMLDVATVDVLGSMSKEYLSILEGWAPTEVINKAPDITIAYISTPSNGHDIKLTASATLKATHLYTDPEVAPGKLDIIVVPGPPPKATFEEGGLTWLREHFETGSVDVLCVCTGILICAAAGIADGRTASGPRPMHEMLQKTFPKVKIVGDKRRWVQDGNFWSSGGVTNGNDLMGAYARSGKHFDREVAELGLKATDTGDRSEYYEDESFEPFDVRV